MKALPAATAVNRILPKEAFYQRLSLSSELKARFVADISHISLANSLTADTLNIQPGCDVKEILLLVVDLKAQDFEYRIIERITRQNQHHLVFQLRYEGWEQFALYCSKLYKTEWQANGELEFDFSGSFTLDDIWSCFVRQIALRQEILPNRQGVEVAELLEKQEHILKLQRDIDKMEKQTRTEKQPKKKYALYTEMQTLKRRLAEEKGEYTWKN
ncbi:MAG: DUF4391 domain-containing protein [Veillonellales bacterium]